MYNQKVKELANDQKMCYNLKTDTIYFNFLSDYWKGKFSHRM